MDKYVKLAKDSIVSYLKTGKIMGIPEDLPESFYSGRKGVFVTIYERSNPRKKLRGCIGTFAPTKSNIAEEIIENAVSSAFYDPRFDPITKEELAGLEFEVSLLYPPQEIESIKKLDAKKYGIIVRSEDRKTGLLLPDIEGVETPEHQISIACQKAGIDQGSEKIQLYRFTVEKHKIN
ncbi:MAG: AmmeMemoRadiSam system protein A [Minisyncoccia bacterium]